MAAAGNSAGTGSAKAPDHLTVTTKAGNSAATGISGDTIASVSAVPGIASGTGDAGIISQLVNAGLASGSGAVYAILSRYPFEEDGASGHEAALAARLISDTEAGSGTDAAGTPAQPFSGTETAVGAETASVVVSVPGPGAPGGAITPRWIFISGTEEYSLPLNPSTTVEPTSSKKIVYQNGLGPNGQSIIFETQGDRPTLSWTGTTLTQAEYQSLIDWFDQGEEFTLLDDLGRAFNIYVTDFTPKRIRSVQYPWKHEYDMKALVL